MKKYYKFALVFIFVFSLISLWTSCKPAVVFADNSQITIENVPAVPVYDETVSYFTIKASLLSAPTLSGADIEWLINGTLITDIYKITIPAENPNSSELKMYRVEYASMTSQDSWLVRAQIKTDHSIYNETTVVFKTSNSPLTILPTGITTKTFSEYMTPFVFSVEGLEEEDVQWYILSNTNKYIKVTDEYAEQRTYTFTPIKAGSYVFIAKVGGYFSDPFMVTASYKTISTIHFTVTQQTENRNGFNTYLFRIDNLDATYDIESINWYIVGYTIPIQYGGTTFLFQPSSYGTYRIRAQAGESQNSPNDEYTIDVKINRTLDIIIGVGVVIGVMGIGLLITIIRNIKREKIW